MRNFRTAAVAAATAVAVSFAGTTVATAQSSNEAPASDAAQATKAPTLSSKIGDDTNADNNVIGTDLLGSSTKDANGKELAADSEWALIWRDATYAAVAAGVVGAVIAAYNYAVYNHILPGHILDPIFR